MICPNCQSQVADGIRFCGTCGKPLTTAAPMQPHAQPVTYPTPPPQQQPGAYVPPNQYEEYGSNQVLGAAVPRAELHNPKGPLKVGDMTITIDGELVPVVDVMLGNQL